MANIKFKRGTTNPTTSDLSQFELAINTSTNEIFTKNSTDSIVMLNLGYQDQTLLQTKVDSIVSANDSNYFQLAEISFMANSKLSATINGLSRMVFDFLDDDSNIDSNLSQTNKYKLESGAIYQQYTNLYTTTGGGTAEHGVGNILRRKYTTPDGYVITSDQYVSTLALSAASCRMDSMFDSSTTATSNDYWLANGATIDGVTPALNFDFLSSGIDIYQIKVYPSGGHANRWMNGDIKTSSDGSIFSTKGSFSGFTKTTSPSSFDTITVNESVVKKMNFICTDAGLSTNSTKSYCINEIVIVPKTSIVVTKQIALGVVPKKLFLVSEHTGDIQYDVSFDDGVSWETNFEIETIYSVPVSVIRENLRLRITLNDGATLRIYGLAWT